MRTHDKTTDFDASCNEPARAEEQGRAELPRGSKATQGTFETHDIDRMFCWWRGTVRGQHTCRGADRSALQKHAPENKKGCEEKAASPKVKERDAPLAQIQKLAAGATCLRKWERNARAEGQILRKVDQRERTNITGVKEQTLQE